MPQQLLDRLEPETARRLRTVTLVALSLTFGLVQLDATIVNVALQTLRSDLGGGVDAAQWAVDGYAVPFAACMLIAGALGDRHAHRRPGSPGHRGGAHAPDVAGDDHRALPRAPRTLPRPRRVGWDRHPRLRR